MIVAEAQVTILPVSVATIFDAPNATALFRANAEECLVPEADPQRAFYLAMEQAGVLKCFASYAGVRLVGFSAILCTDMPDHPGKSLATIKNVFVDPAYRGTGAGDLLLDAAEQYATEAGCMAFTASARVDSAFDKVLSRRAGYTLTHSQHTRWLA